MGGSTLLNKKFYDFLTERLEPTDFDHPEDFDPDKGGRRTIHKVIMDDKVMGKFETTVKRNMNFDEPLQPSFKQFNIEGLRRSIFKAYHPDWLNIEK